MRWGNLNCIAVKDAFFVVHKEMKDVWVCCCSETRNQSGSGFTNLAYHIITDHPDEYKTLQHDFEDTIQYLPPLFQIYVDTEDNRIL